ncbi:MAG: L-ribulose-5-phosphate 4-epimerase [Clostridiales Family XIII bacterium]|nr:L-ribulose-5-phosphate 4-epimerase [Clostridiales Family XIII bacterium]
MEELKRRVCEANRLLPEHGLVTFTWGNVSEIDRASGIVAIKPSGLEYDGMQPDDIVLVDLDGQVVEGWHKPSSDTPTHLAMYLGFPNIGGIVHTHSHWATVFAQQKREIPVFGTTHADYFHGSVPCTRDMTDAEIEGDYEQNTGLLIVKTCRDPDGTPAALVASHGPFAWGKDGQEAVHNAAVLEIVASMAWHCGDMPSIDKNLLDRHFFRKHGADAYYGQT